jgi:hypothetical protein
VKEFGFDGRQTDPAHPCASPLPQWATTVSGVHAQDPVAARGAWAPIMPAAAGRLIDLMGGTYLPTDTEGVGLRRYLCPVLAAPGLLTANDQV